MTKINCLPVKILWEVAINDKTYKINKTAARLVFEKKKRLFQRITYKRKIDKYSPKAL